MEHSSSGSRKFDNEKSNSELEKSKGEPEKVADSTSPKTTTKKKNKLVKSPSLDHRGVKALHHGSLGHNRSNSSDEKATTVKEQAMGEVSKKYW